MSIISTLTGNIKLKKPTRILFTPYKDGVKGDTTYALDSVVADSTSITQDEATRDETLCETRDEPLDENVTLGSYQFTCDNADWQSVLATNLLGFTEDPVSKNIYAPSAYVENYVEIEVQFGDANSYEGPENRGSFILSVVLPKVLLSSAATMESLKTSLGTMTVAGTAYSVEVVDGSNKYTTAYYFSQKPVAQAE